MKSSFIFLLVAFLFLLFGCVGTDTGKQTSSTQTSQTTQQKTPEVDLGISDSDLNIDDPAIDPTTDSFEGPGSP